MNEAVHAVHMIMLADKDRQRFAKQAALHKQASLRKRAQGQPWYKKLLNNTVNKVVDWKSEDQAGKAQAAMALLGASALGLGGWAIADALSQGKSTANKIVGGIAGMALGGVGGYAAAQSLIDAAKKDKQKDLSQKLTKGVQDAGNSVQTALSPFNAPNTATKLPRAIYNGLFGGKDKSFWGTLTQNSKRDENGNPDSYGQAIGQAGGALGFVPAYYYGNKWMAKPLRHLLSDNVFHTSLGSVAKKLTSGGNGTLRLDDLTQVIRNNMGYLPGSAKKLPAGTGLPSTVEDMNAVLNRLSISPKQRLDIIDIVRSRGTAPLAQQDIDNIVRIIGQDNAPKSTLSKILDPVAGALSADATRLYKKVNGWINRSLPEQDASKIKNRATIATLAPQYEAAMNRMAALQARLTDPSIPKTPAQIIDLKDRILQAHMQAKNIADNARHYGARQLGLNNARQLRTLSNNANFSQFFRPGTDAYTNKQALTTAGILQSIRDKSTGTYDWGKLTKLDQATLGGQAAVQNLRVRLAANNGDIARTVRLPPQMVLYMQRPGRSVMNLIRGIPGFNYLPMPARWKVPTAVPPRGNIERVKIRLR